MRLKKKIKIAIDSPAGAGAWTQAKLISKWMSISFIHGVMNTDNCSIIGDTIVSDKQFVITDINEDNLLNVVDIIDIVNIILSN